jgi:hypothetical protein
MINYGFAAARRSAWVGRIVVSDNRLLRGALSARSDRSRSLAAARLAHLDDHHQGRDRIKHGQTPAEIIDLRHGVPPSVRMDDEGATTSAAPASEAHAAFLGRLRPSPVLARISSHSNSARPPSTVSISGAQNQQPVLRWRPHVRGRAAKTRPWAAWLCCPYR